MVRFTASEQLFSSKSALFQQHVESGKGGIVELGLLPKQRMLLSTTVGELLQAFNKEFKRYWDSAVRLTWMADVALVSVMEGGDLV